MSALLVTGGAGFIGSCFVRQCLAGEGPQVVVVDKLTYAGSRDALAAVQADPRLHFEQLDIVDGQRVLQLLRDHDVGAVVNFAAESHVDRSIAAPAPFVMTNVVGTCHLLEAARRHWGDLDSSRQASFRFVHVSTDEVYGSLGPTGAFAESTPYAPSSPYAASKAASDHFARAYHRTYRLPVILTNCSNNFGPYQHPEKLIPRMILNALAGQPLPIYGDGEHVRDWLFVEDHCRALQLVLDRGRPGEVYNLGGNCERTNLALVHRLCEILDRVAHQLPRRPSASLITMVADRPGHDRRYAMDTAKAQRELQWRPTHSFDDALEQTVRWYLEHEDWARDMDLQGN